MILKTTLRGYFFLCNFNLLNKTEKLIYSLNKSHTGGEKNGKEVGNGCGGVAEGNVPKGKSVSP